MLVPVGTGAIVDGVAEPIPGLDVLNFRDDPRLRLRWNEDARARKTRWIRQVVLHTTKGIPGGEDKRTQDIRPGLGPPVQAGLRVARWWSTSPASAGAHLVVDHDGAVACLADLLTDATMHAGHANGTSIGVELFQGAGAELYEGQLLVVVRFCDWLTRRFGIQRQIPHAYVGPSQRLKEELRDVVGVLGHRDLSDRRGPGDPGNAVMNRLGLAGYEPLNFDLREDLEIWRRRQRGMGLKPDGVPGPITVAALRKLGRPHGMWVRRPGDAPGPELVS